MKNRKIIFFVLFFIASLIWGLIVQPLNLDEVWNYGFAHNIYKGLIPYKDFNMVLTPFFPFVMSLGFHIFGSNILILYIENSIILTIMAIILDKLIGKNSLIVLLFIFFPLSIAFPSYNIFIFFLFVIIIYLEKNNKSDYLIGLMLGLAILTKQSVGVCMVIPSLYYLKRKDKILKRLIGMFIPLFIFLLFLLFTGSFNRFIDLCILGLFDFAGENNKNIIFFYVFLIIFVIIYICVLRKHKSIVNYYCLSFISMMVPIFDVYHIEVAFLSILLLIFLNYKIDLKINLYLFFFGIIIGISILMILKYHKTIIYPNDINHFEYKMLDKDSIEFTKEINKFISDNKDKTVICIHSSGYYIKIVNDMEINYLDLINRGNWGYNGSDKLMKEIKKVDNPIFLVDKGELHPLMQTDKRLIKYVLKKGKKIGSIRIYDIYIFE